MKIIDYLTTKHSSFIWIIALLLNFIIGFLDYVTGYEIRMEVFYLVPISLISWFISRNAGFIMSVVSMATSTYANIFAGKAIESYLTETWNILVNFGFFLVVVYLVSEEKIISVNNETLINKLKKALDEVKTLTGLLPICSSCKKICDDHGYWKQIELYIGEHTDAEFSHGLCPECRKKIYFEFLNKQ